MNQNDIKNNPSFFYHQHVPPYPTELLKSLAAEFDLTNKSEDTMLDLGYGGGEATFGLAKFFKRVYAWDEDQVSLEIASHIIDSKGLKNIILEQKNSNDIDSFEEKLRLVVIAQSMQSIDGQVVFKKLHQKIAKGGGIAIIRGSYGDAKTTWQRYIQGQKDTIVNQVLRKYLKPKENDLTANDDKVNKSDYSELLKAAGFKKVREQIFEAEIERTIADMIGWIYSFKWSSKEKFGAKAAKFEKELKNKLKPISKDGIFKDNVYYTLITAKK